MSKLMNVVANTNEAFLFAYHKIPMDCSEACQTFRFGDNAKNLLKSLVNSWDKLKLTAEIALVTSFVLFGCALVKLFTMNNPS